FDYSFLRNIPNITIMAPKDEHEFEAMIKTAVNHKKGAVAIRYPRGEVTGIEAPQKMEKIKIGEGELLTSGDDVTLIAVGTTVIPALNAAKKLNDEGIAADVINARFVKPLDSDLIVDSARRTKNIVTIEENVLMGGFGSAVLEELENHEIFDIRTLRIGIPDKFIEHGDQNKLRKKYGIDEESIYKRVKEFLGK
ncbi:transketolase C-terminal domain-containing protein, partial [Thermodesulfobacteriota bacterium]